MKSFPFSLRCALVSIVLPLFAFLFSFYFYGGYSQENTFGFLVTGALLPLAMLLVIFFKGYWRLGIVVALGAFLLNGFFLQRDGFPDGDQRVIELDHLGYSMYGGTPVGTEVYCNGVKLGTIPFTIRLGELKEKVPRWTKQPKQKWFIDGDVPIYTWIPWDHFIRERFDARNSLSTAEEIKHFDAGSEFWWSFRYNGSTAIGCKTGNDLQPAAFSSAQFPGSNAFSLVFPAERLLNDLLMTELHADSQEEENWTPSEAWLAFLAERGQLLDDDFDRIYQRQTPGQKSFGPLLDAVARKRYGLSQPATEEECERLILNILDKENNTRRSLFTTDAIYTSYGPGNVRIYGPSYRCQYPILVRAIRQMGEACKEPLLRRCREEFSQDIGVQKVTALLYMLKEHPFPEFFDEFVQYYAQQYRGFSTLAAFDDPRVPGLIQTFLKREPLFRSETMGEKSRSLMLIDNPKWDALVRNVLAQELPKLNNEREVGQLVDLFVQKRIFDMEMDKAELAEWVKKLRVKGMIKVRALAMCEPRIEEHDPDLVYAIRPGQEPLELSWKELARQVREAPADKDFLDTYQRWAGESDLSATLNVWIRNRRFMNEDADTEIIFRRILQDKEVSRIILAHLASLFGLFAERMSYTSSDGRHYTTRTVTVPGTYVQIQQTASHISADDTNAMLNASLPGYFMECFGDPEFSGDRTLAAKLLIYIEGPEAAKVLETWLETEDWQLKTVVQEALDQHGYRDAIRLRHREIFQQLCAGEISPDEIVSKQ